MEAIEKMARLCMRDPDEEEEEGTDEDDVEADDDLLVSVACREASPWSPSSGCMSHRLSPRRRN